MYRLSLSILALACLLVLPACDSGGSGDDERTRITGTFTGDFTQNGTDYSVTVTLQQTADTAINGDNVEGSGVVDAPDQSVSFTSSGTFSTSSLSLDLSYEAAGRPGFLTGTANATLDTLRNAQISGSELGLDSPPFILTRR